MKTFNDYITSAFPTKINIATKSKSWLLSPRCLFQNNPRTCFLLLIVFFSSTRESSVEMRIEQLNNLQLSMANGRKTGSTNRTRDKKYAVHGFSKTVCQRVPQTQNVHLKRFIRIRNIILHCAFKKFNIFHSHQLRKQRTTLSFQLTARLQWKMNFAFFRAVKSDKIVEFWQEWVKWKEGEKRRDGESLKSTEIFYADIFMSYNVHNCIICF